MTKEEIAQSLSKKTTGIKIYKEQLSSEQQTKAKDKLKEIVQNKKAEFVFKNYIYSGYCNIKTNLDTYVSDMTNGIILKVAEKNGKNSIYEVDTIDDIIAYKQIVLKSEENTAKNNGSPSTALNNYIKAIIACAMGLIDDQNHEPYTKKTLQVNNDLYTDENNLSEDIFSSKTTIIEYKNKALPLQTIFYGSPGCGKSHEVKDLLEDNCIGDVYQFRTTFHPDCDYYSFVGAYKPKKDPNTTSSITYDFSPQVFTKAYIKAWENMLNPQNDEDGVQVIEPCVLVIEEINRGNCAQIFGDLFQLLDRDSEGYSEYPIKANEDLISYIKTNCKNPNAYSNDELRLPPNLYIIATMNTSDQSLFPMDSAFKRRWAWKYMPIICEDTKNGEPIESAQYTITIGGVKYKWHDFLKQINDKIYAITNSEDKKLGNFFIKGEIGEEEFVDKIMFYLWNDVLKLEYATGNNSFFKYDTNEQKDKSFMFNELFESDRTDILKGFMKKLEVKHWPNNDKDTTHPNAEDEAEKPEGTE